MVVLVVFLTGCSILHSIKHNVTPKPIDQNVNMSIGGRSVEIVGLSELVIAVSPVSRSLYACRPHIYGADLRKYFINALKLEFIKFLNDKNIIGDLNVDIVVGLVLRYRSLTLSWKANAAVKVWISIEQNGSSPVEFTGIYPHIHVRAGLFCAGGSDAITQALSGAISGSLKSIAEQISNSKNFRIFPKTAVPTGSSNSKNSSSPVQPKGRSIEGRLKELKRLLDLGLISKKEYRDKRARIIETL